MLETSGASDSSQTRPAPETRRISPGEVLHLGDRVLRPASRPKPIGARLKISLEDRLQHQLEGGLHHTITDRRDPEIAQRAATLRDRSLLDRQRPKRPSAKLLTELAQELLHALHAPRSERQSAHRSRPSVTLGSRAPDATRPSAWRDRRPGCAGLRTCTADHQMPTCAACAGSRVPAPPPASASATTRRYSTTTSSPSRRALQARCPPSPCAGLSPALTTPKAPPRTQTISRHRAVPNLGRSGSVPTFTVVRSAGSAPSFSPAAPVATVTQHPSRTPSDAKLSPPRAKNP